MALARLKLISCQTTTVFIKGLIDLNIMHPYMQRSEGLNLQGINWLIYYYVITGIGWHTVFWLTPDDFIQ